MDYIVVSAYEIAEGEQAEGKDGERHAEDAQKADKDAFRIVALFGASSYNPVDAMPDAVKYHEDGFGGADGKKSEHEGADPWLMFGLHVVAAHDESRAAGNSE